MRTAISPVADIKPLASPEYAVTNTNTTYDVNDSRYGLGSTPSGPIRAPVPSPDRIRILLLAANPRSTGWLAIDEEARAIEEGIQLSLHRDRFEFIPRLAVQPKDLFRLVSQHQPHILHFSGHGADTGEILLSAGGGAGRPVGVEALAKFFRVMRKDIRVVLLNACYTAAQAQAIGRHIDFVIGTRAAISDEAARVFAAEFYSALGFGSTVQEAFDQAKTALDLHGLPGHGDPQLVTRTGTDIHLLSHNQPPEEAPRKWPWPKIWSLASIAVAFTTVVLFGAINAMAGLFGTSHSPSPTVMPSSALPATAASLPTATTDAAQDSAKPSPSIRTQTPRPQPQPAKTTPAGGYVGRQMTVSPNEACGRTEVDFDRPEGWILNPADASMGDRVDFIYHACARGIKAPPNFAVRIGHTSSSTPSREQCANDALNGIANPEPIENVHVGTAYCVKTNTEAMAWAVVTELGPWGPSGLPTLTLTVTLWT